ncbi:MAG: dockerin type I repeat-containing protein [Clostridiales bacterium]|nr:dockerin type I repeat-containing protein [Clostridiales bacterium]
MSIKRFLCIVLSALMVLALIPAASLAEGVTARAEENRKLALLDNAWKSIEAVEKQAINTKASPAEITMAAYNAALNDPLIDKGSLVWEGTEQFAFTVEGMHCVFCYRARNAKHVSTMSSEALSEVFAEKTGNCAGSPNVLLVGPYYSSDSHFTDQYKNEADSIGAATGGTVTKLVNANATGPNIAAAYINKGVVIYDSHGTQSGTSSYLCLTTNTGITTTDYNNGWAVSSGSAAYIDGRYIENHVSGTLSNCMVWMAICEGMKKAGQGTTGYALLRAGAACVYGYSQSVTFSGDYEYEEVFWNQMKNGATVAEALEVMIDEWGIPDPDGDAYPILMSPVDPFPSNPDGAQVVNCDWTLFSQDPIALEGIEITNNELEPVDKISMAIARQDIARILADPVNANTFTCEWSIADTSVATIAPASNGKSCTITGVSIGSTTLTLTATDEDGSVYTDSVTVRITDATHYVPTDTIEVGKNYVIGFVVNGNTYLMMNYNPNPAGYGNYYYSSSSNYFGYTAQAVMSGDDVIGCSGWTTEIEHCLWNFSSTTGGTISSAYQEGYNLSTWNSGSYSDLYPASGSTCSWTWNASAHTLSTTYPGSTRYASYLASVGGYSNFMQNVGSANANCYVQLFVETLPAEVDPGDVNGDGSINSADAMLIIRYTMQLAELTDEQLAAADVNGDGIVNSADAMLIIRMSMGLA